MLRSALVLALAAFLLGESPEVPGLKLEILLPKKTYEIGEPIEITLKHSYSGEERLAIWHVTYDRCGRIMDFGFTAKDEEGDAVPDPIGGHLGGFGGGMRSSGPLAPGRHWEQPVVVNEWLRFDRPGRYRVTAWSGVVGYDTGETGDPSGEAIPLTSDPVEIEIVARDPKRTDARLAKAKEGLAAEDDRAREAAARDLRFLLDPRAIPLLLDAMGDESGNVEIEAWFGLVSLADLAPVKAAVLARVEKKGEAITVEEVTDYLQLLVAADMREKGIEGGWEAEGWWDAYREADKRWRPVLLAPLRKGLEKRPPAEAVAAYVDGMALGSLFPRDDLEIWKFVLRHISQAPVGLVASRASYLISSLKVRELIPDLLALARDPQAEGSLRGAAIVGLHGMGDDSCRDLVFDDLVSSSPRLTSQAHATLGEYRAKEVGEALLERFFETEGEERARAAERIRDFGGTIPATKLREALDETKGTDVSGRWPLVVALAMARPEDVVPILEHSLADPVLPGPGWRFEEIRLLASLDAPGAQSLLRSLLLSPEAGARVVALQQLTQAHQQAVMEPLGLEHAFCPRYPRARIAPRFVPELLLLARGDPSAEVRQQARVALACATGLPEEGGWGTSDEDGATLIPGWEAWWTENGACHGRWGSVRHGIAMRVASTGTAVFGPDEPIRVEVRFRRQSGARKLRDRIGVTAAFRGEGRTGREDVQRGEAIPIAPPKALGEAPGSEVVVQLDLRKAGIFTRPGVYRIYVRHALVPPNQQTNWQEEDIVRAHPIEIRVREKKD